MECKVIFETKKAKNGNDYIAVSLDFGNGLVVQLRDYNAVEKIRFIKSIKGD